MLQSLVPALARLTTQTHSFEKHLSRSRPGHGSSYHDPPNWHRYALHQYQAFDAASWSAIANGADGQRFLLVHMVRDPLEVVISGYCASAALDLSTSESRPASALLAHPEIDGSSLSTTGYHLRVNDRGVVPIDLEELRGLDTQAGLEFEAAADLPSSLLNMQQATDAYRGDPRVLTIGLEEVVEDVRLGASNPQTQSCS